MKKLIVLALAFASCAAQGEKPSAVNLTYVKSPLNAPLIVGKEKGIFEEAFQKKGIIINWHEINSGAQQTEAMASGSVDVSPVLGGTSVILAAANGADIKVMNIFSRAPKAFTIAVKDPAIKSAADLKGKKIAGPKGSVLHQLLAAALLKEGLAIDDTTFVSLSFSEALSALSSGNLDAALLPANTKSAVAQIGGRILLDGEGLIQGSTLTAVRGDFAKKYPDLVQVFRQAHKEALSYMKANPEETAALASQALDISPDEVNANIVFYNFDPVISPQDKDDLSATQDFLVEAGLLEQTADISALILP